MMGLNGMPEPEVLSAYARSTQNFRNSYFDFSFKSQSVEIYIKIELNELIKMTEHTKH